MNTNRNLFGKTGIVAEAHKREGLRGVLGRRTLLVGSFLSGLAAAIPAYTQQRQQGQIPNQANANTDRLANPNKELAGKVAIVTGARANLGRGFAVALAKNGADVVVHYHRPSTLAEAEETARLVQAQGTRAILVPGDLSQIANIRKLFDETMNAFGRVDIVVQNAGQIVKKPLVEVTEEEYDRLYGINAKGTFFIMQEAARRLSDNGRIINIATSLLASTIGNYSPYAGSKAAMEDFSRALAKEIDRKKGITVNTVAPGPVDTPFFHSQETPESVAIITQLAGRLGEVNDIVPVVEFLASPRSQWVNAQIIFVNGGYVTR